MENQTLKEVYKNGSDEVKQEEFNKFFREILEKYIKNVRFYEDKRYRYEIFDENGRWLFDVDYNPENKQFWYSYDRILPIFKEIFGVNTQELKELMIPVLEQDFKLVEVTPDQ